LVGGGGCTSSATAPASPVPAVAPGAGPAVPAAVAAGPAPGAPPEKAALNVAVAAVGTLSLPLQVAIDAGYFQHHGLTVDMSVVAASVAVQGLIAGGIDIYQGGAAAIAGHLGGADIIYVGAAVDRNSLILFGERGLTTFPQFRGKTIAT